MVTKKRNLHTYKAQDKHYQRAFNKAKKNGQALATLIEDFVIDYGKPVKKSNGIPLPADYVDVKGVVILNADGNTSPIDVKKK